jgi:hypothetical protein
LSVRNPAKRRVFAASELSKIHGKLSKIHGNGFELTFVVRVTKVRPPILGVGNTFPVSPIPVNAPPNLKFAARHLAKFPLLTTTDNRQELCCIQPSVGGLGVFCEPRL